MVRQYYNTNEFTKILSLADTDPFLAKTLYEEYLKKYSNDYSAYLYYTSLLITLGEFEKAEKTLEFIRNSFNNNFKYNRDPGRRDHFECNYNFTKARLLCYKKQYDEAHSLTFFPYSETSKNINLDAIRFYCKSRIEKLNINRDEISSYSYKQIYEYRENDFIEHITKHMADYNQNIDNPNKYIFAPDFPIEEIIREIKKHIPSDKRLFLGFFEDVYFFKYDGCGRSNNKITDYFKVVCFHDTTNFITMLPLNDCEKLPYTDLNYLKKDEKPMVKRKNRIELFNQRYNRN